MLRGALGGEPFDFEGRYYHVEGATVNRSPSPRRSCTSAARRTAAELVAAKHVDVYLAWGEPPAMVAPRLDRMRELAAEHGRTLRFGIRLHVIARDRAKDAWAETDRFLEPLDPASSTGPRRRSPGASPSASSGWSRCTAASRDDLVSPRTCGPGIGLVRGGAGTALVGSHEEIADRIEEYHAARLRRVHPLRPPAPRGGLLVRRGRDADPAPRGPARRRSSATPRHRARARRISGGEHPLQASVRQGGGRRRAASRSTRRAPARSRSW